MSEVGAIADHQVPEVDAGRRKFLTAATAAVAGVGVVVTVVPFVESWQPSERARALGAPVEVDLTKLSVGQMVTPIWRRQPIYVVRRDPKMVDALSKNDGNLKDPKSDNSIQPKYAQNEMRSVRPDVLVLIGICTHLGCLPKQFFDAGDAALGPTWPGGFRCPCHGSRFDLAGRVMDGSPAPTNLSVPPYTFKGDNTLVVGVDDTNKSKSDGGSGLMTTEANSKAAAAPGLWGWINKRLPVDFLWRSQWADYIAPKNFNFWYFFGSLALLVLVMQLLTGIFLTMFYKVGETTAFDSVEFIMREVNYGWLIRYLHSTGASAFFLVIYLHMYRALLYGSYKAPRELLWLFGMIIYLALMAEAFMGYVLPWGNMSFWAATVIINLFSTIPGIGPGLVEWIRGDYGVSDATLNRFFSLHVVAIPLILLLLVALHLIALHEVGSNNPDGIEIKNKKGADGKPLDGIPSHPYYTVKDILGVCVFLVGFAVVVFFIPTMGDLFLEKANFEPANPLSTPDPISPSWYFTPYYAILRAFPSKSVGALAMLVAVTAFFFLPWLDRSPVKSIRYRGWIFKFFLALFTIAFLGLMYLGLQPAQGIYVTMSRILAVPYFAFFLLMPWYTRWDPVKPVPERVTYQHG